jgi:hypothetical protein
MDFGGENSALRQTVDCDFLIRQEQDDNKSNRRDNRSAAPEACGLDDK